MRRCTSFAPAFFNITTNFFMVEPRTIESSTTTTRLPLSTAVHRVEFQPHRAVAQRLTGLDERTPDVVVPNQPKLEANARLLGETETGSIARVRHGNDDVGVDRVVPGEHNAQLPTNLVDVFPEHLAVRTREVDELENALGLRLLIERLPGPNPPIVNNDEFPWLNFPDIFGADDIQRTGFAGDDGGIAQPAEAERAEGLRVAHGDERILGQK
jgi:hypothetical protein